MFRKINVLMRDIGMEIRTLIVLDEDGSRKRIHGIVNMVRKIG